MLDAFPLADLLTAMTSGTGDCAAVYDVIPLMSIAGWALLGFVLLFAASVMQLRLGLR
jgi:disulfide bond formation protein DsbB